MFFFGNGDLVSYDLAGARRWARNLQKDYGDWAFQWTFGASPTLYDGRLYLPILQRDQPTDGSKTEIQACEASAPCSLGCPGGGRVIR